MTAYKAHHESKRRALRLVVLIFHTLRKATTLIARKGEGGHLRRKGMHREGEKEQGKGRHIRGRKVGGKGGSIGKGNRRRERICRATAVPSKGCTSN
jgi:hypothetical protein